ncbi:KALRN-like protein [Mya arenaria]|uniref:KALRN-like protein n=1 Tax=Mya arenaria TaxID=6604 RepID=A0ABY7ELT5_MYAAR|nr:KALRN-like protein [Mya arenaria]
MIESGTIAVGRVLFTYNAIREDEISVNKGETVHVLGTNQYNMFLIHRPANDVSPAAEGVVPLYVIGPKEGDPSFKRNTWQLFKQLRTPPASLDRFEWNGMSSFESRSKTLPLTKDSRNKSAVFTCRICGRPRPNVTWTFNSNISVVPDHRTITAYREDGVVTLQISQVTAADSGEYTCVANSDIGGVVTRATLTVLDRPDPPSKPDMKTQVGTSVHLEWRPPSTVSCGQIQGYTIEFNEVGLDYWQAGIPYVPTTSQVIGDLSPGAIYQFRVRANNTIGMSDHSIPSDFVAIPTESELTENADGNFTTWKTTYENDFTELEELERGRFSIVKKTSQNCSGQHFAAKYIKKRGTCKALVETEYNTVQSLQHPGIVRPENLLLDISNSVAMVKLTDFGDARHIYNNYYVHAASGDPEFLAPEIVAGTPVGLLAVGVVLYVMLSGVSPFLDESEEETCSNILRTDFCFPDEFFAGVTAEAKEFIKTLLVDDMGKRPTAHTCLDSAWLKRAALHRSNQIRPRPISTARFGHILIRSDVGASDERHISQFFIMTLCVYKVSFSSLFSPIPLPQHVTLYY